MPIPPEKVITISRKKRRWLIPTEFVVRLSPQITLKKGFFPGISQQLILIR
jgi:hypothetical protein